jgi:hypothetical protein
MYIGKLGSKQYDTGQRLCPDIPFRSIPPMDKFMYKAFSLIIAAFLLLTGCEKELSKDIDYGVFENGVYINEYFGMSIEVPKDWAIQSQAVQKELMNSGVGLIAGDDENLKTVLEESKTQTVNMFVFYKYERGAPVPFNPSFASVAERMTHMPGIKRGSDYLFHARKMFESGQMKYEFPHEIYSKDISGVSFDVMPMEININNITVYQEYYSARIDDYVLSFILSYSSDAEMNELNDVFSKLHFSK